MSASLTSSSTPTPSNVSPAPQLALLVTFKALSSPAQNATAPLLWIGREGVADCSVIDSLCLIGTLSHASSVLVEASLTSYHSHASLASAIAPNAYSLIRTV